MLFVYLFQKNENDSLELKPETSEQKVPEPKEPGSDRKKGEIFNKSVTSVNLVETDVVAMDVKTLKKGLSSRPTETSPCSCSGVVTPVATAHTSAITFGEGKEQVPATLAETPGNVAVSTGSTHSPDKRDFDMAVSSSPSTPSSLTKPKARGRRTPKCSRPTTPVQAAGFPHLTPVEFRVAPEAPEAPSDGASYASLAARLTGDDLKPPPQASASQENQLPSLLKLPLKFIDERDVKSIACIAYYSLGGKEHLSAYLKESTSIVTFCKTENDTFSKTRDDTRLISTLAVSPKGHHIVLAPDGRSIDVYAWPFVHLFNQFTKAGAAFKVSATENFYFYSFTKCDQVYVACMSIRDVGAVAEWTQIAGMRQHRTMNAMEQGHKLCVLVSRHLEFGRQAKEAHTPALTALDDSGILWHISFQTLASSGRKFDMCCIDNDGRNFYVLNAQAKCVYIVSPAG